MIHKIGWLLQSAHFGTALISALMVALPLCWGELDECFIWVSILAMTTSTMIGFLLNDLSDVDRDQINKTFRPLASGRITKKMVVYFSCGLGIILLGSLTYLLSCSQCTLFLLAYFITYVLYNQINKVTGLLKNITISIGFVFPYLFVTSQLQIVQQNIMLLCSTLFFFLYRELLMDINDKDGDEKTGLMTIPVRFDDFVARLLVAVYWMIAVLFLIAHTVVFSLDFRTVNLCFLIVVILTVQNFVWNNFSLSMRNMRILLMSMWGPMFLSVLTIKM